MSESHYVVIEPTSFTGTGAGQYTYATPDQLAVGQIVVVPLARKEVTGVVVATGVPKPSFATKPVSRVLDLAPLPEHLIALAGWVSGYYAAAPSSVWQTMLPSGITKKRRPLASSTPGPLTPLPPLTSDQAAAIHAIHHATQPVLLYGVTGSGKTRVYQELAAEALAAGRDVIILIPEIALTPQTEERFVGAFGANTVISTHSRLTEAERHHQWDRAQSATTPRLVLGPRSALFLPLRNPGLIIIDECHETTYKQEQNPKYWATAVAGKLAQLAGAQLVMGSATPGINEVYLAQQGRLALVRLDRRIHGGAHPPTHIIDLRDKSLLGRSRIMSEPLLKALEQTLGEGRQSLLFLNRRGSATSQSCPDCGWVNLCPHCRLPFTFHADDTLLLCHLCGRRATPPAVCPDCGSYEIRFAGSGTKKLEAELGRLLPKARLARLDADSAKGDYLAGVYAQLHAGTVDIVIGTQMIAKGLDLPALDTVGIVSADSLLAMPDYTAAERTYGLIAQAAGRAGRTGAEGRVFIQTHMPEHPAIAAAARGDFWGFASAELAERQALGFPPHRYLAKFTVQASSEDAAIKGATSLLGQIRTAHPQIELLGPAPAWHAHLGKNYYYQIVAKSTHRAALSQIAHNLPKAVTVDLDPQNLL